MTPESFVPGLPTPIAAGVQRVVAPNASAMTGPGTNSFVLGDPAIAVLDPGPDDDAHLQALLRIAPRLQFIFVTHTHRDHSPLAMRLAHASGATLVGMPPPDDGRQDQSFAPQIVPRRDQIFALGALRLRAIDTPGHASNHVCYLLDGQGLLFSGDHILDGVTPVILAPDGDMSAYLDSLQRLKSYELQAIAPGHGRVLLQPQTVIDGIVAHRLRREQKVIDALGSLASGTLEQLLPIVYSDVRPELHRWARLSLEAHLIKLAREQRACCSGDRWHLP